MGYYKLRELDNANRAAYIFRREIDEQSDEAIYR